MTMMMISNKEKSNTTMKRPLDYQETSVPTTSSRNKRVRLSRKNKRVRFHCDQEEHDTTAAAAAAAADAVGPLLPPVILTEEICQRLWFQKSDLAMFRTESRKLVLFGKQSPDDEFTGLEKFTLERSRRKHAAIKCVLLAHNKGYDTESLRIISTKISHEPLLFGLLQGFNIYCQVYDPLTCLFGENNDNDNDGSSCLKTSCGAGDVEFSYEDALFGEDVAISTHDHDDLIKEEDEYNTEERMLLKTKTKQISDLF